MYYNIVVKYYVTKEIGVRSWREQQPLAMVSIYRLIQVRLNRFKRLVMEGVTISNNLKNTSYSINQFIIIQFRENFVLLI